MNTCLHFSVRQTNNTKNILHILNILNILNFEVLEEFNQMKYYNMKVAGLDRALPICRVTDDLYIGAFVIFGDPELTIACASSSLLPNTIISLQPKPRAFRLFTKWLVSTATRHISLRARRPSST